jgi:hypothetical protein
MTSRSRKAAGDKTLESSGSVAQVEKASSAALEKPSITKWEKEKPYSLRRFYKWELEQDLHSRKAAGGVQVGSNPHPARKASAALEKPLLDRMRYYEKYCKKEKGREWEIRGSNTFAWGIEVAAAVQKHRKRNFIVGCCECSICKELVSLFDKENLECWNCANDLDFGTVE